MKIKTTVHDNKITAKGGGKQRTVPILEGFTLSQNHGLAAGTLMQALVIGDTAREHALLDVTFTDNGDGSATFTFPAVKMNR